MTVTNVETRSRDTGEYPLAEGTFSIALKTNCSSFNEIPYSPTETYCELLIDSFIWKGRKHSISPSLLFKFRFNEETKLTEVVGTNLYQDVLVYGEMLYDAVYILRREILPILWEDCVDEDNVKLSEKAKKMAVDLKSRVKHNAPENKKS